MFHVIIHVYPLQAQGPMADDYGTVQPDHGCRFAANRDRAMALQLFVYYCKTSVLCFRIFYTYKNHYKHYFEKFLIVMTELNCKISDLTKICIFAKNM